MTSTFPIVGIGASAGGIEAFVQLLKHLDPQTGIAIVFVQHLDPDHESMLTEIFARETTLPVVTVSDGMVVESNHIYIIPQNVLMTVQDGKLLLSPRVPKGEENCPINEFFISLARELKQNAIGIVLSGTGTDGVKGLAAINTAGGITIAQDVKSARFNGMPSAAIAAGVDFALSPMDIALKLANIAQFPDLPANQKQREQNLSVLDELDSKDLKSILHLLHTSKGLNFSHYKPPTIQRRIYRRMMLHKMNKAGKYIDFLRENPAELDALYEDILIKVTHFFRTPECFRALKEQVFPQIFKDRSLDMPVRIWVPGCCTGEEVYSTAICLLEFLQENAIATKIEIFGTDVSEVALAQARQGQYSESIQEHVSPERLARFFTREGNGYRINTRVRECCIFAKQNVAQDPPFSKLDLISCHNLLIYLTPATQKRVMTAFHFALKPVGFLSLGNAESVGMVADLFRTVDNVNKLYAKIPSVPGVVPHSFFVKNEIKEKGDELASVGVRRGEVTNRLDLKSLADRAIQSNFVPPGVVINSNTEVIHVRGDISPFLMVPPGELTADLLKMCRPGLLLDLRSALYDAMASNEPVKKEGWIKSQKQPSLAITLHVIPFSDSSTSQRYFVILFEPRNVLPQEPIDMSVNASQEIKRLERELEETKAYLTAIIEKEQAVNEELKSASEEILSANEELQSTSEEIATSKEETQATNEELVTVNDELRSRNQELDRVGSDLTNLFGSIQIPIIMLTENLVIRHFTPSAEKALNLTSRDLGRSLSEISSKLNFEGLIALASDVLESLNTKEQEVQDKGGHWYSLRITPYRTAANKIEGAVISLFDIDSMKRSFAQLKDAHDYTEAIVLTMPVPLLVLDADLRVVTANEAFYRHFRVDPAETLGSKIYALGNGQWNASKLRELLEEILPKNEAIDNYEVEHEFPSLGRRIMQLSARRLVQPRDKATRILLAILDLTEQKRAETMLNAAKNAAETANQEKSDFLANMSHELRTPLGAILGYTEVLADSTTTHADAMLSATRIRKNVEHLTELIDEILDIAKIEAGKLEVEFVRFLLLPELSETFTLLRKRAEDKGLFFQTTFDGKIPESVTGCPKRLRQILINIVGNAIKFTEQGSIFITISLMASSEAQSGSLLRFVVTDTGPGLSANQQSRLFQAFSQADSSVTRRFGGTGLGLVLARRLANALGGNVALTTSQVEKGSTFTITLDPGFLAGVPLLDGLISKDLEPKELQTSDWFAGNQKLFGLKLLLVEDGADNQLLISRFLTVSGADVDVAENGEIALEKIRAGNFDVVLMDIQMPVLDGYETMKRLKAEGCQTPIIALTAHAMQGEKEKCLAAGCVEYISKPVKPSALIDIVKEVSKKKDLEALESSGASLLADDPVVGPLVLGFVQNLPLRMEALQSAEQRSDWAEVANLAHQMSGSAGGYGFPELGKIAARIEMQAKDRRNPKALSQSIVAFQSLCNRAILNNHSTHH
jgi:two-component system CheB/CheR fusion protein